MRSTSFRQRTETDWPRRQPVFNRVYQFYRAAFVPVSPQEYDVLGTHLTEEQSQLFRCMARCDQRHCLDVFYALRNANYRDGTVLRAALLHDVGKSAARLRIWHRVAAVLLDLFNPDWARRLAANGWAWARPFAVHVDHAELGARSAAEAGCSPEIVSLIRRHHKLESGDSTLAALQWADRYN